MEVGETDTHTERENERKKEEVRKEAVRKEAVRKRGTEGERKRVCACVVEGRRERERQKKTGRKIERANL